ISVRRILIGGGFGDNISYPLTIHATLKDGKAFDNTQSVRIAAPQQQYSLGQQFELIPGQIASITGESLKVRFVEIVADSRCPTGVQCIWAGEVSCLVEIDYSGTTSRIVLTQGGSGPATTGFNKYEIAFGVQPYPEAGKQIDKAAYRLQLTISKKAATSGGMPGGVSLAQQGPPAEESCG
ncbi:MAG: hypothetical protein Q7T05_04760, partial [Dehalococcoidia bacterium]|nr:hypothetical protein [Dehalococcoidia bacterium]